MVQVAGADVGAGPLQLTDVGAEGSLWCSRQYWDITPFG